MYHESPEEPNHKIDQCFIRLIFRMNYISSVLLRNPEYYTLPIGLYKLVTDKMGASYTTFAAGAILISIPIALVFLALQKHFVSGLTAGGTKG